MTWIVTAIAGGGATSAALIGGGASLLSGYMGANAAKDAANTQAAGANAAVQQQREMFNIQNEQQKPYREAGYTALSDIAGMKPYLNKKYSAEDFYADPSYQFRLNQGNVATQNLRNQAGGAVGGNTLKAMMDYNSGAASTEYGAANTRFQNERSGIYDRLASIAGIGQTSQGQTNQLAQNVAGSIGQATIGAANAQAAGQVGSANAYGGALQGAGNQYALSQYLKPAGVTPVSSMGQTSASPIDLANPFAGAKLPSYSAG
jgi:hypothetical protein